MTCFAPAGGWKHGSREERALYWFFWRYSRVAVPLSEPAFRLLASRPRLRALAMRDMVRRPSRVDADLALSTRKLQKDKYAGI